MCLCWFWLSHVACLACVWCRVAPPFVLFFCFFFSLVPLGVQQRLSQDTKGSRCMELMTKTFGSFKRRRGVPNIGKPLEGIGMVRHGACHGVVWCGVVWSGVGVVWCGVVWPGVGVVMLMLRCVLWYCGAMCGVDGMAATQYGRAEVLHVYLVSRLAPSGFDGHIDFRFRDVLQEMPLVLYFAVRPPDPPPPPPCSFVSLCIHARAHVVRVVLSIVPSCVVAGFYLAFPGCFCCASWWCRRC